MKIRNTAGTVCIKKHLYDRGISLYRYASVKKAVYRFKYAGRQEYAAFFGKEMAWHLGRQILSWKVDALVPVPLHPARKRKRGYNQAELLALEIGKQLGLRVENNWLIRTKNTSSAEAFKWAGTTKIKV